MIEYIEGDMFEYAGLAVIPVNCTGYLDGLVLKQAVTYVPEVGEKYQQMASDGEIKIGYPVAVQLSDGFGVVFFPTKNHWRGQARMIHIMSGLRELPQAISGVGLDVQILIPKLGCGTGRLQWAQVQQPMHRLLSRIKHNIYVFV